MSGFRALRICFAALVALLANVPMPAQSTPQFPAPQSPGAAIEDAAKAAASDRTPPKETTKDRQEVGSVEILSDTQGVDFHPYLKGIVSTIRHKWYSLIPHEMRYGKGKPVIEFKILRDGKISDMKLAESAGLELDRPAWDSIRASNPLPALPEAFHGDHLRLRFRFYYNPGLSDLKELRRGTNSTPPL